MANTRKVGFLERSERSYSGTKESLRQAESLQQSDRIIELLTEQNKMLKYLADLAFRAEQRAVDGS